MSDLGRCHRLATELADGLSALCRESEPIITRLLIPAAFNQAASIQRTLSFLKSEQAKAAQIEKIKEGGK